jgi:hypothetical protein
MGQLTVTHGFTSAIADDPAAEAAGEVLPSHWNADHVVSGAGSVTAEVDFGAVGDVATVYVAATWVTASSILVCQVAGIANDDHDVEDALLEQITVNAYGISASVGFSIRAHAPNTTWGRYTINVVGL